MTKHKNQHTAGSIVQSRVVLLLLRSQDLS
jgi:hypothetical protein